jgi:hypothetical protein
MSLRNQGVFYDRGKFVVFGGRGKNSLCDKYFLLDEQAELKTTGELKTLGKFNNKAVGVFDGTFSIVISQNEMMEYRDGYFKRVVAEI